ncbi:hypothetical protein EMCRGX_G008044 [Ephydatia muelleri]
MIANEMKVGLLTDALMWHTCLFHVRHGSELPHFCIWQYPSVIAILLTRSGVEVNPGPSEEPVPRWGHVATIYNNMLYLWGGKLVVEDSAAKERTISVVNAFDVITKTWTTHTTTGPCPTASERCAYTTNGASLYIFGGYDYLSTEHDNSLHRLHLDTLSWTKMPSSAESDPEKKSSAGLAYQMDMLVLFGGFGFPPKNQHPTAIYEEKRKYFRDGRGWTNDLYVYFFTDGIWQFKPSQGTPQPSNGFSFVSYRENYIFKYGGSAAYMSTKEEILLDEDDLVDVLEEVSDVATNWKGLGLKLGL